MSNNTVSKGTEENGSYWSILGAAAAAVGAVAGGVYLYSKASEKQKDNIMSTCARSNEILRQSTSRASGEFRENPPINNLNALLSDIYDRYISLNDDDRRHHYDVFTQLFRKLDTAMREVDPYYNKYSSMKKYAGSHYDGLRIKKYDDYPDEDIDIVIGLPLCLRINTANPRESDIIIEPKSPGYVQLKGGAQFRNLLMRDGAEWLINKTAYEWKDDKDYLLRSKFIAWFQSVVDKALNKFALGLSGLRIFFVDGEQYTISKSASGPAVTLIIENRSRGFKLDVDLVPALKFFEDRWPVCRGYRSIPEGCNSEIWMVVPKPIKGQHFNDHDKARSWRIALHDQERKLMHGTNHLRQAIRLMKKLRDSQAMDKIASYYIKTLFFWEITRQDAQFWSKNNPATIFNIMVHRLHTALVEGNIPYFWEKSNNLIGHINRYTLNTYALQISKLIEILDGANTNYKLVAKFLLNKTEFEDYNRKILHI